MVRPALAVLALALSASVVRAEGTSLRRTYLEVGSSQIAVESPGSFPQAGLRFSNLVSARPGVEFALAVWIGHAVVLPDLDFALPIPVAPGVHLVPRAGVSALIVAGGGVGGAAAAGNVGLGLVFTGDGPVSVRADFTLRRFRPVSDEPTIDLNTVSVGIGFGGPR